MVKKAWLCGNSRSCCRRPGKHGRSWGQGEARAVEQRTALRSTLEECEQDLMKNRKPV